MQSFREPSAHQLPELSVSFPVAADLAVSVSTLPILMLITGGDALANGLVQLGLASEELFRGDRLPSRPLLTIKDNEAAKDKEETVKDV